MMHKKSDVQSLLNKKIICIGDSLTAGDLGKSNYGIMTIQPQSYPYFLAQKTGAVTKNMGNCGWTAEMTWNNKLNGKPFLENIEWDGADIVLILLGANGHLKGSVFGNIDASIINDLAGDNYNNYNLGSADNPNQLGYYGSIIKYVQKKAPNAKIVLMTRSISPSRPISSMNYLAETIRKVGEHFGLQVIDNYTGLGITEANKDAYIGDDGVHMTVAGYEKMAEYIAKQLNCCFDTEKDKMIPKVYNIDGKRIVFVKNLNGNKNYSSVNYHGEIYIAFSTMNNAIAALGKLGGVIKVFGEFLEDPDYNTDVMGFIDIHARNHILIEGIDENSVWEFKSEIKFWGDVTFSNLTLRQTTHSGGLVISVTGKTEFREDCVIDTTRGWIFLSCGKDTILNGNKFTKVDFLGNANLVSPSISKPVNLQVILNYGYPDNYPDLNCGYTGNSKDFYGNLNIYINGTGIGQVPSDSNPYGREITQRNVSDKNGIFTIIFNNGSSRTKDPDDILENKTSHYNSLISSNIDYIVRSDKGGKVEVIKNGDISLNRAPIFKLIPDSAELVPYVGGVELKKSGNEYFYTPGLSTTQTTISISWLKPDISKTYSLNYKILENEQYGFMGRWFDRNVEGVDCKATITTGSELYFKVQNTENVILSLKSEAKQPPTLAVSIDGKAPVRVFTSRIGNTVIAQGLNRKISHTIRVIVDGFYEYQKNKWNTGKGFVFEKAIVDDGGIISGIYPKNKVILYFGDSITEGVHALYKGSNPYGNSYIGTYAFTNSSLLGMASFVSGYGGTGITKGGSGGVPKCIEVINNIYGEDSSLPSYPNKEDIAAIIINHGANDNVANVDSELFKSEYAVVVERLEELFPNVPIVALVNMHGAMKEEVETVANQMAASGINIYSIAVGGGTGANMNYESLDWCHPTSNGGKFLGTRLANELKHNHNLK